MRAATIGSDLDTAYMSPLPTPVAAAMAADATRAGREGSRRLAARTEEGEEVRAAASRLMGSAADDVAFVASTTQGIGLVAAGLDWRAGDQVLVAAGDHPSVVLPFRARADVGVEVVEVATGPDGALDPEAVAHTLEAAGGRVRVVAVSWVRADRGRGSTWLRWRRSPRARRPALRGSDPGPRRHPLRPVRLGRRCRRRRGPEVDARTPRHRGGPRLGRGPPTPAGPGPDGEAAGHEPGPGPLTYADAARRHESGTPNHAGRAGLGAALDLLHAAGTEAVWTWVDRLVGRLVEGLEGAGAEVLTRRPEGAGSGIVAAVVPGPGDAEEAVGRLGEAGVVASARRGAVRFAVDGWNDDTDVDAAVEAVAALLRST